MAIFGMQLWGCDADCAGDVPCSCQLLDATAPDQPAEAAEDGEASDADVSVFVDFCAASWGVQAGIHLGCCTAEEQAGQAYNYLHGIAESFSYECHDKLSRSASKGRIVLQADAAAQCADRFNTTFGTMGCQMIWTGIDWEASSCRDAVKGVQGDGAPCRYRYECEEGLFCFGYSDGVDGTCGKPPGGGMCRAEEVSFATDDVMDSMLGHHPECESGMTCLLTSGVVGVCAKTVSAGGNCVYSSDCDSGLRCHLGTCGTEGPASQAGACNVNADCVQRLYCSHGDGGTAGTCTPRKGAGEPCTTIYDECNGYCASSDGGTFATCVDFCGSG